MRLPSMRNVAGVALEHIARKLRERGGSRVEPEVLAALGEQAERLSGVPGWESFNKFLAQRKQELLHTLVHGESEATPSIRAKLQELDYLAAWQDNTIMDGKKAKELLNG